MRSGAWKVTATLVGDDIDIIYRGDKELVNHHLEWSVDHWMWAHPRVLVLCLFSSFYSQVCNHCNTHVIPLFDAHDNQGVREYFFRDWENAGTVVGGHRHMNPA